MTDDVLNRSPVHALLAAGAQTHPGYRALLAETQGRVIGLAEYDTGGDDKDSAETSIAVSDGLHHRGVGTLLVEHLVSAARAEGIVTFTADALSENHEVLCLFADLGLRTERRFDGTRAPAPTSCPATASRRSRGPGPRPRTTPPWPRSGCAASTDAWS